VVKEDLLMDRLFNRANQAKYIAVAAPDVDILVPAPNGGVQLTTGTSLATAHVSGVAALLVAQNPKRTPDDIRNILTATAKDLGPKGVDPALRGLRKLKRRHGLIIA
jgi:subtilisin family serine protease